MVTQVNRVVKEVDRCGGEEDEEQPPPRHLYLEQEVPFQ